MNISNQFVINLTIKVVLLCVIFLNNSICDVLNSSADNEQIIVKRYSNFPYFTSDINISTNIIRFYDATEVRTCLSNTSIAMLGDSTMDERLMDIAVLLSDIGNDTALLDYYVKLFTNTRLSNEIFMPKEVNVFHYYRNRNVTVEIPSLDIRIRYRFTGHHDLQDNFGGIQTFHEKSFKEELYCLLGLRYYCPRVDILVLNSGLHDIEYFNSTNRLEQSTIFRSKLNRFLIQLVAWYELNNPNVRIFWPSLFINKVLATRSNAVIVDDIAYNVISEFNKFSSIQVEYVNLTSIIDVCPQCILDILYYTSDGIHFGAIGRYRKFHQLGTLSVLMSLKLLTAICN